VCNLRPSSRGKVTIQSSDYRSDPIIAPNYLSTDEDRKVAADSLRMTRRIAAQPALARYYPYEYKPGLQYETDEQLAKAGRRNRHDDFPSSRDRKHGSFVQPKGGGGQPSTRTWHSWTSSS